MTDNSMVCNGHREIKIEKCPTQELLFLNKLKSEPADSVVPEDNMTIGTIPFPEFDHLYASSIGESETNSNIMIAARSILNSCHLNIIEEQAKSLELQNQEISKLRKQNELLIARIERMNRRLNLNQCSRRIKKRCAYPDSNVNIYNKRSEHFLDNSDHKYEINRYNESDFGNTIQNSDVDGNQTASFRIRFQQKVPDSGQEYRKCSKMVRFVEAKRCSSFSTMDELKRNSAQAVDEKLKLENAVLFLKTAFNGKPAKEVIPGNYDDPDVEDTSIVQKKRLKFPIITTHEPFYMAVRNDIDSPITYTPTSLEVPSYGVIERDNTNPSNVLKDNFEDVTLESAKDRHLRFEIGEKKRKKWDVQRIRELRQNELLKEKLLQRKSRWNKLDSSKITSVEGLEQISTLFPDIKNIEKIIITNLIPITALGISIAKIPSWGVDFHTLWTNDGTADVNQFEKSETSHQPHHQYHRETRSKLP